MRRSFLGVLLVITACTKDLDSELRLARDYHRDQKFVQAVFMYEKIISKDSRSCQGLQARKELIDLKLHALARPEEALSHLDWLIHSGKDPAMSAKARFDRAEVFLEHLGKISEAIHHYEDFLKYLDANPFSLLEELRWKAHLRISECAQRQFHFEKAVQYLETMRTLAPEPWKELALFEMANLFFLAAEKKVSSTPVESHSLSKKKSKNMGISEALVSIGTFESAQVLYQHFIHTYPKSSKVPEAIFSAGLCMEELGNLDAALMEYRKIEHTYPSLEVIKGKLSHIEHRLSQNQKLIQSGS